MKTFKITLIALLSLFINFLHGQAFKTPKMAPIYTAGYYINFKGDTVKGKIQVNPDSETDFYKQFAFLKGNTKRAKIMQPKRIRGYGFANKNFVAITSDGKNYFMERLTNGRLRFYEYRYITSGNNKTYIDSEYFIKDSEASGTNAELQNPHKLSGKFYKKSLKPFMKEQPEIWRELDKFNFNQAEIVSAIEKYNQLYASSAN